MHEPPPAGHRATVPARQVRAVHDATTVTVYQAFGHPVADAALAAGTFVAPFSFTRMTWIKPSFLWTMHRSGWAGEPQQERVLAVRLLRSGFEAALAASCLSSHAAAGLDRAAWRRRLRSSPVRVQWDPERDLHLRALPWRSLQVGLSGRAVHDYVGTWVLQLTDVTALAHRVRALVAGGDLDAARAALPREEPYPLPDDVADRIGVDRCTTTTTPDRRAR